MYLPLHGDHSYRAKTHVFVVRINRYVDTVATVGVYQPHVSDLQRFFLRPLTSSACNVEEFFAKFRHLKPMKRFRKSVWSGGTFILWKNVGSASQGGCHPCTCVSTSRATTSLKHTHFVYLCGIRTFQGTCSHIVLSLLSTLEVNMTHRIGINKCWQPLIRTPRMSRLSVRMTEHFTMLFPKWPCSRFVFRCCFHRFGIKWPKWTSPSRVRVYTYHDNDVVFPHPNRVGIRSHRQ